MSGTFEDIDVPPTLVSFAVTTDDVTNIISPEFKEVDNNVFMFTPEYDEEGLPKAESLKAIYKAIHQMIKDGTIISAYTPGYGGAAEAVLKMSMGNEIGFAYSEDVDLEKIFGYAYGAFVVEVSSEAIDNIIGADIIDLGKTTAEKAIVRGDERIDLAGIEKIYEDKLEPIYSCNIETADNKLETFRYETSERLHAKVRVEKPKVLIPVFPGNNCEYDSAKAFRDAGAEPEIFVINNLSAEAVAKSVEDFAAKVRESQIIFIPGGFSGGDEPDGSGKFITAFFRNQEVKEAVTDLLDHREGLMVGICNGFQALIKLGLVPYGKIMDIDETFPTLTFNEIGRHQSKLVRTRIASNKSPWLANAKPDEIYTVPISHGEGRFIASEELIQELAENGQITTQYVDFDGKVTSDIQFNPNGSYYAIEGITSPDGRVFGKMGHAERTGAGLYKNVPGDFDIGMFKAAVEYFK